MPLLITRDAETAETQAQTLTAQGLPSLAAPCVVFHDMPLDLGTFAGQQLDLLLTSPRVVPRLPPLDPAWRVLALAPTTTAALKAAGIRVDLSSPGGAAALARLARPGLLLHLTSDLGGDEVLRVRPDATVRVAYRTDCPPSLPPEALAALEGNFELLFYSPSAVDNFERLAPGALSRATCVYFQGGTTRDALLARGVEAERWEG